MDDLLEIALFERSNFMDDAILYKLLQGRDEPLLRSNKYGRFNLQNLTEQECKLQFRFQQNDIPRLAKALALPEKIETQHRYTVSGKLKKKLRSYI